MPDTMNTETGGVTGTQDKDYNIIWFTETCLNNVLRLDTYIKDAERGHDDELAESVLGHPTRSFSPREKRDLISSRSCTECRDRDRGADRGSDVRQRPSMSSARRASRSALASHRNRSTKRQPLVAIRVRSGSS